MTEHPSLIFAALVTFLYALVSKKAEHSPITAPMVFVAMGLAVSPVGLDLFSLHVESELLHLLTEITLVLILFVDASNLNFHRTLHDKAVPARMLFIGLPLSMALGAFIAYLIFSEITIWMLVLMAFILSPTDAALGEAVVKSSAIPERIRRWISIESGLNDGIALPPIFAVLAVLAAESDALQTHWVVFLVQQIVFGAVFGSAVGWIGGYLINYFDHKRYMDPTFERLTSGALAILAFSVAEMMGGNGFIAAFMGGLMLGATTRTPAIRERIAEFGEAEGQQLVLFVFLLFAMSMVPQAIGYWDWRAVLYGVLSLTVIRMLPVALSLMGQKLDSATILFLGWFGPRGIASVLYLLLVVQTLGLEGHEYILSVIVLTVLMSIFAHGISAVPLSRRYGNAHNQKS